MWLPLPISDLFSRYKASPSKSEYQSIRPDDCPEAEPSDSLHEDAQLVNHDVPNHSMLVYIVVLAIGFILGAMSIKLASFWDDYEERRGGLASDKIFGQIPMRKVVWEKNKDFMESDPLDAYFWATEGGEWSAWDEIHRGSWIQLPFSPHLEIFGGLPLAEYSYEETWPADMQGFVPSVLHDIHCIGNIKHMFMKLHKNSTSSLVHDDYMHATHCLEHLRQSVMCHGDLALEKPLENGSFVQATGWGTSHYCRDWSVLYPMLTKRSIGFKWGGPGPLSVYSNSDDV